MRGSGQSRPGAARRPGILRFVQALLLALALAGALAAERGEAAEAARRVALVVGNNAYRNVAALAKAVNDARAVAKTLKEVGFEVIERENLDRRGMNQALSEFVDRLSAGGVGLFYFAGHGVQIGGSNYLVPVDVPALGDQEELRDEAIEVARILERLTEAKTRLNIVILDACRDNPFPKIAGRSLARARGLANPEAPSGILIIYSAGANQVALDSLGPGDRNPNGLFTRKLLTVMREPGLRLDEAVRRIRHDVSTAAEAAGGEQNPAIYDQTDADFYFVQPGAAAAPAPAAGAPAESDKEALFWQSIKDSTEPADFRAYLKQFPKGVFADLARTRIAALERGTAAAETSRSAAAPKAPPSKPPAPPRQAAAPQSTPPPAAVPTAPPAAGPPAAAAQQQASVPPAASQPAAAPAAAGGRFDGEWRGTAGSGTYNESVGFACRNMDMKVKVLGDKLSGVEIASLFTESVSGTIAGDGALSGSIGRGEFSGRFEGDRFRGSFRRGECGSGSVELERAR